MVFQSHYQRFSRFLAFGTEMVIEKIMMCAVFMEMMRRQHDRKYGNFCVQLHLHHAFNHCLSNEVVAIDASINNKPAPTMAL